MSDRQVFKVQTSIGGRLGRVLVYNEDRSVMGEFALGPDLLELLRLAGPKSFWLAKVSHGSLILTGAMQVEDPGW